ncbi:MAG: alpha/beta fold hydrolase [Clostridia bacterium]|nr:alpha/beta fold hydrolase [Clostridia bacterium]
MRKGLALFLSAMLLLSGMPSSAEDTCQQVFEAIWSEDEQAMQLLWERMDTAAQQQISPAILASLKGQLTQAYGAWLFNGESSKAVSGGLTIYQLPVHLERLSLQMQLVLQDETIVGLSFTPLTAAATPKPVQPAEGVEEIAITVGEETAYPLPGILTLPREGTNLPLAVLVHGSGPNDRNESVGATQLFRDLAHALACQGIASLRYDKRTYVHGASFTQEQLAALTVQEETIEDALRAAELAKTFESIDPKNIWIIGHSLGAMLAPRIVREGEGLFAGMVLLSGSPKTLLEIMINQNQAAVDTLSGQVKDQQQSLLDAYISDAQRVLALDKDQVYGETIFGQPAYYFWEMERYDTAELLKKIDVPSLIINGGSDFQVTDADGIFAWKDALLSSSNIELVYEPDLNHLLMTYTGDPQYQGTIKEYDTPAVLDEGVSQRIGAWILNH